VHQRATARAKNLLSASTVVPAVFACWTARRRYETAALMPSSPWSSKPLGNISAKFNCATRPQFVSEYYTLSMRR